MYDPILRTHSFILTSSLHRHPGDLLQPRLPHPSAIPFHQHPSLQRLWRRIKLESRRPQSPRARIGHRVLEVPPLPQSSSAKTRGELLERTLPPLLLETACKQGPLRDLLPLIVALRYRELRLGRAFADVWCQGPPRGIPQAGLHPRMPRRRRNSGTKRGKMERMGLRIRPNLPNPPHDPLDQEFKHQLARAHLELAHLLVDLLLAALCLRPLTSALPNLRHLARETLLLQEPAPERVLTPFRRRSETSQRR